MAVVRTITAHCDARYCNRTLQIPSDTTQQWQFITSQGWRLDYDLNPEMIATICPLHPVQS